MGLRCLLGHDFGPSGVVREHEEDGSEMVVTERELRRCRRCGEEQVLSESTEVRAIRREEDVRQERRDADAVAPASSTQGADVGDEASPLGEDSSSPAPGDSQPAESTPDTDALRTAAESVSGPGDAGPASASGTAPELDSAAADTTGEDDDAESDTSLIERAEAGFDEPADPDEEDAVILDDEDDGPARERGAWPDSSDVGSDSNASAPGDSPVDPTATESPSAPDESPEHGDAEAADDAEPQSLAERAAEEDAELMGSSSAGESDTDASETPQPDTAPTEGEGAWPAHDGEDEGFSAGTATAGGPGMAYGNELTPGSNSGSANGRSQPDQPDGDYETSYLENTIEQRDGDGTIVSAGSSERTAPRPGAETEYYCPNCGHTRPLDSSLRTGDICPECQQGYIAERER